MLQKDFLEDKLKGYYNSRFTKTKWNTFLSSIQEITYDSYGEEIKDREYEGVRLMYVASLMNLKDEQAPVMYIELRKDEKGKKSVCMGSFARTERPGLVALLNTRMIEFWESCDPERNHATYIIDELKMTLTYEV